MISLFSSAPCLHFVTLGCAKNEVDTAHMIDAVRCAGFSVVGSVEEAQAIIVNTCSFIQAATEESIEMILELADLDTVKGGNTKLIVSGCLPSRYGADAVVELSEVDAFVACDEEDELVEVLDRLFKIDRSELLDESCLPDSIEVSVSAYVKISDGCDRWCSYCTIPFIRGPYQSFSQESIEAEVEALVEKGVKEVVLIAQDTGRWGRDLKKPQQLSDLLHALATAFPSTWFRVMYLQPEGITDGLLEVIGAHDTICNYFDIPLQHCNEVLLKAMNRSGSAESYKQLVARLREQVPGCTLRTTLIAGFPGETEEMFEELCDFVEEAQFDYVGVFAYSREEGTGAADLPDQIDDEEKLERAQVLRDLADNIGIKRVAQQITSTQRVLIEGVEEDGQIYGRTQAQAPEVDGVVYVSQGNKGELREVRIEDSFLYDMEGE